MCRIVAVWASVGEFLVLVWVESRGVMLDRGNLGRKEDEFFG